MKNHTVGFIYFGVDVVCSLIVLISVGIVIQNPQLEEWTMALVSPIVANSPVSLIIVPWLKDMTERTEWFLLIFGLSLGCIQCYFVGWTSAWAFKHKKQKSPWGWILFVIFVVWSAFIGFNFIISLCASCGIFSELFF